MVGALAIYLLYGLLFGSEVVRIQRPVIFIQCNLIDVFLVKNFYEIVQMVLGQLDLQGFQGFFEFENGDALLVLPVAEAVEFLGRDVDLA